jgi:hypothetical protein
MRLLLLLVLMRVLILLLPILPGRLSRAAWLQPSSLNSSRRTFPGALWCPALGAPTRGPPSLTPVLLLLLLLLLLPLLLPLQMAVPALKLLLLLLPDPAAATASKCTASSPIKASSQSSDGR